MNNPLLSDDVVIVGGGTGRVARTLLRTLLDHGARLAVVSRSGERARSAIDEQLRGNERERAIAIEADLANFDDGERAVAQTVAHFGRVDSAISLAGGGTPFVEVVRATPDDLGRSVRNNLVVAFSLMLPTLRAMLAQDVRPNARSRGRLVAVTAGSSLDPQPRFGIMGVGKAGVNTLMLAIAREHKGDGIVANAIVLGGVAIDEAREYLSEEEFSAAASPQEVADTLAFHASDASTGVNGSLVHLNAREVD